MNHLRKLSLIVFLLPLGFLSCDQNCETKEAPLSEVIDEGLQFSLNQSLAMAASLKDKEGELPKTTDRFGNLETCRSAWWVSGFFPGQLWYMYEYSNDEILKNLAHDFSMRVQQEQYTTDNHDVGFMIFCSFGNGYRLTKNEAYKPIIENASKSLSTRFNPIIGATQSWGSNSKWQYPVIIDNMMNLELLMWSAEEFNEPKFKEIALAHSNTTIKHHFRDDFSTYHLVSYDTISGQPHVKNTAQGYADESAWARGQSWGLYGYTLMYRFTKDPVYLAQAQHIADYLTNHPNMPADLIPYWDYNAPNIPDCQKDVSAAAIMCSALIELSEYTEGDKSKLYLKTADQQIRNMSTSQYRNSPGTNGNFILKGSVGHMPANSEINVPLSYADYYYIEALIRRKKLLENGTL